MINLNLKIKIEILGANIVIEDADVKLKITKTDEAKPNYCTCTIYNLSEDTYNKINDKANSLRIYINHQENQQDNNWVLIFEGNLRDLKKYKKAKQKAKSKNKEGSLKKSAPKPAQQYYNEPPIRREGEVDIETIIELQDGIKNLFLNTFYSKSYSGKVSNKQIIKDCIDFMKSNDIPVGRIDDIPERIYTNGKIVHGQMINILKSITSDVNCIASCQNNVFSIVNKENKNIDYTIVLNGDICESPTFETDKRIKVIAPLLPTINPTDYIQLDFKDVNGAYRIAQVEHNVDNFGEDYTTEITLKY